MHTRIRYIKDLNQEHLLVTKDSYMGKDKILCAKIDTHTMSYKILEVKGDASEAVVSYGAAKTLAEVKKHVKATLKGLGVPFNEEVRNKTNEGSGD